MAPANPDSKRPSEPAAVPVSTRRKRVTLSLFGAFLGLAVLKFGNPPIMEKWVTAPTDLFEFILGNPWPMMWAYALLAAVAVLGLFTVISKPSAPLWMVGLPCFWLVWQLVASGGTIQPDLSRTVVAHFVACVVCFYLGLFGSNTERSLKWLMPGLLCAFVIVLAAGWQQHFGGLEQTRRYFFLYLYPKMKEVSPEYIKKLSSTRIFSTLFYPNALAGAILLLLPVSLQFVWQARQRFTTSARAFLVASIGAGAFGCLYWSGSKGGWLLLLLLIVCWLLRLPFELKYKQGVVAGLLVLGLFGFFWKYSGFFQKGATSVTARFDYWSASIHSAMAHPVVGTGPGTFAITYQKLKRPESEMARLAHNDYLQQASDSGLPGGLLYLGFVVTVLVVTFPRLSLAAPRSRVTTGRSEQPSGGAAVREVLSSEQSLWFAVWLGTLGWSLQSLMEFGLYIPALAWPAFAFLGSLLAQRFGTNLTHAGDNTSDDAVADTVERKPAHRAHRESHRQQPRA